MCICVCVCVCVCVCTHAHTCSVHTSAYVCCLHADVCVHTCMHVLWGWSWILDLQLHELAWKHSHTCVRTHTHTHTHAHTHTHTHTHRLTHPLPKPKQWSIIRIHILLWATSVPLLRKNWSQNRLLTVNCRTLSRPLTTRKRPLWTHAFNRPAIRVNGGLVWECSDLSLDLWRSPFLKNPKGSEYNGGFVEAVIVILVLVLFLVIVGELSGMSQLSSGLCVVCGVRACVHVGLCSFLWTHAAIRTGCWQTLSDFWAKLSHHHLKKIRHLVSH